MAEYLPLLGAIVLIASVSFGQLGETTQRQGANITTELGGGNGTAIQLASNSPNIPAGPIATGGGSSSGSSDTNDSSSNEGGGSTDNSSPSISTDPSQNDGNGNNDPAGDNNADGSSGGGGNGGSTASDSSNDADANDAGVGGEATPGDPEEQEPPLLSVDGLIDFGQGFWQGARTQGEDLWQMIRHPIQTVESFYTLGRALIEDPEAVFTAIREEIGQDIESILSGDAREIGRILGENISPAAVLRVANRVAHIARRLDNDGRTDVSGCTRRSSFSADTIVWTDKGFKQISDVKVGDLVWSRNDKTFEDSYRKVTELLTREVDHYYEVTVQREKIKTTEEHPFWQQGAGWISTQNLIKGETLVAAKGDLTLRKVERIDQRLKVYNLVVETDHTYFVSQYGLWVHNQGDGPGCSLSNNVLHEGLQVGEEIAGLTIQQVRQGTNGRVAIIGGPMPNVRRAADELINNRDLPDTELSILDDNYLHGRRFRIDGEDITVNEAFEDMINNPSYDRVDGSNYVTDADLPNTQMYRLNQQWIQAMQDEGYTIVDIGGATSSLFYRMELDTVLWD